MFIQTFKTAVFKALSALLSKHAIVLPRSKITYSSDLLFTYHNADFQYDPKFAHIYQLVKQVDGGRTLSNYDIQWRIHVLCYFANWAKTLEGDYVDCGVYTGFCPRAVMEYIDFPSTGKKYYLLDTFQGLPVEYATESELKRNTVLGYSKESTYEYVKETFKDFNVEIIKGMIPDTLPQIDTAKICFLHIDLNSVKPEIDALEYCWPKIPKGGIVLLDDYAYAGCIDQKKAHDAFARSKEVEILSLPTCQGLIIKPY